MFIHCYDMYSCKWLYDFKRCPKLYRSGEKIYEEKDIQKLSFLMTLKNVGMSIQDMKQYIQYISEGDSTLSQRIDILTRYRQTLLEKSHTCYKSIDILDYFIYQMKTKQ